jgi:hypothetical protein
MDPRLYKALKQINKHGNAPPIVLADKLEVKIGLIELKYIEQTAKGFYRLNRLGKKAFRKERWNRIKERVSRIVKWFSRLVANGH